MKSIVFIFLTFWVSTIGFGQTTITITPDATTGKDALLVDRPTQSNVNYGAEPDFASWAWTQSSTNTTARSLIDFDLSTIPAGAIITSASLSLYCNTNSAYTQLQSGTNASYIERVTSPWNESTVTWNTQPTTTTINRVFLATSTTNTQNYTNIDITQLILDIQANPSSGFGLMLKLQTESTFKAMIFASSDHGDILKRPKLQITYSLTPPVPCQNTLTLQPNGVQGMDALIDSKSNAKNTNFGTIQDFASWSWTISGDSTKVRSLIQFDFSSIPVNATLNSAQLSLWCNTTSAVTQLHSGLNESYIQRIINPWKEDSVTWNNQPATTTVNQVLLPTSISASQNYLSIDVTNLILDMKNNPGAGYGMMLKLATELNFRSMIFASSDHPDPTKRPKLEICYTLPAPPIVLANFNGGDKVLRNTVKRISWVSTNATANVSIQYTLNNGSTWYPIAAMTKDTGFFDWLLPDTLSNQCKIRVASFENPTMADTSDALFSIVNPPGYTILSPNGGESFYNDTVLQINWTGTNRNNIKIEYTLNDTNWYAVTANVTQSNTTFLWYPAFLNSAKVKIRIVDILFPQYGDTSNSTFTIKPTPTFAFTYPNVANELWWSGVSKTITWNSTASRLGRLECSINNGPWTLVADSLAPLVNSYVYTPVGLHKATIQFRLSDVDVPYKYYASHAVKVNEKPVLNFVAPNGGEWLFTGNTKTITWTSSFSDSVSLYYSTNGFTWSLIAANIISANGSYQWVMPAVPSNTYRLLISDMKFSSMFDTTDAVFSIRNTPQFMFTNPVSNQKWLIGDEQVISWTASSSRYARIDYSIDSNIWVKIADSIPSSTTTYKWTPTGPHKSAVKFRISDIDLPGTFVVSNAVKMYEKPVLSVLSPNNGERIIKGSVYPVTWSSSYSDSIDIYYSTNGTSWSPVALNVNAGNGTLNWTVPLINSTTVSLKINDSRFSMFADTTNLHFSIISVPVISLASPNGGEIWLNTGTYPITWITSDVIKMKILYSTNDTTWIPVATSVAASTGSYNWSLPVINSIKVKVKLVDEDFSFVSDSSNTSFAILTPPSVSLLSPNGGEHWYTDSTYSITWNSVNVPAVNLYYTTNDTTWTNIALNIASISTPNNYSWMVPSSLVSSNLKIKAISILDSVVYDKSDAVFQTSVFISSGLNNMVLREDAIQLYPNPSNGTFTLITPPDMGTYRVSIMDISGKVVYEQSLVTTAASIQPGDSLSQGMYMVKIETETGAAIIKRLVIAK